MSDCEDSDQDMNSKFSKSTYKKKNLVKRGSTAVSGGERRRSVMPSVGMGLLGTKTFI